MGPRWPHGLCARLRMERSGFKPWPAMLCSGHSLRSCANVALSRIPPRYEGYSGQDTSLSQCLSQPGVTLHGLPTHPGGEQILLVASCVRNQEKLRHDGSLGSYEDFKQITLRAYLMNANVTLVNIPLPRRRSLRSSRNLFAPLGADVLRDEPKQRLPRRRLDVCMYVLQ